MPKPNWAPSPTDTMSLAALRWFACTIEAYSIELYASDRTTFPHLEKVLRKTLKELGMAKINGLVSDEDCPEGYVLCGGLCKPACDFEEAAEASAASYAKKGTRRARTADAKRR